MSIGAPPAPFTSGGGAVQRRVAELAREQARRGHDVTVLAPAERSGSREIDGVRLDQYLCGLFGEYSRSSVQRLIDSGGVQVNDKTAKAINVEDPFKGSYKKLLFNLDGTRLLGGILVGDATEYGQLSMLAKSTEPLSLPPSELLFGKNGEHKSAGAAITAIPNDAQVCSCNNVSKGQICDRHQLENR